MSEGLPERPDEQPYVMAVLCSDGPENGYRLRLSRAALGGHVEVGHEGRVFRWDGSYDEHGDSRLRAES